MGEPRDNRETLMDYFKNYPMASSCRELTIMSDNFDFQLQIMRSHLAYVDRCVPVKICPAVVTDIDLGAIFYRRINFLVPIFGGLNALLHPVKENGFAAIKIVTKPWCISNASLFADVPLPPSSLNLSRPAATDPFPSPPSMRSSPSVYASSRQAWLPMLSMERTCVRL